MLACRAFNGLNLLILQENKSIIHKYMDKKTNKYVAVAYKLYAIEGDSVELVEEATVEKPFQFITGFGITLDDFENAVYPLEEGGEFDIKLTKDQAYGDHLEERVLHLDKEIFSINGHFDHENIFRDAVVPLQNEDGQRFMGHVLDITDDKVVMDMNHPLSGMELNFKGKVVESREATNAEIEGMINRLSGEDCGCGCDGCGHGHDDQGHGEGCCGGHGQGGCKGHHHNHGHEGGCCGGHGEGEGGQHHKHGGCGNHRH